MRRTLFSLGILAAMAGSLCLAFARPALPVTAQEPSPRPPLSATDQYLTAIAQPTQPPVSGGGDAPAPSATPSPSPRPATRLPASTAASSPTAAPTATPAPSSQTTAPPTPVVIVQTVVQVRTVIQVQTVVVPVTAAPGATPTATAAPAPPPAASASVETPGWLLAVLAFPFVVLGVGLWWLGGRSFNLPAPYPERGRPRRAGRLPGRRLDD